MTCDYDEDYEGRGAPQGGYRDYWLSVPRAVCTEWARASVAEQVFTAIGVTTRLGAGCGQATHQYTTGIVDHHPRASAAAAGLVKGVAALCRLAGPR
jgi:hypothetical protein